MNNYEEKYCYKNKKVESNLQTMPQKTWYTMNCV